MQFGISNIPPGEEGTDATIRAISALVQESLEKPTIRLKALSIVNGSGVPNHNQEKAAHSLYKFVKSNIRYIPDPIGVETVQAPEITLKLSAGDCDDHTALLSALSMSIGIPVRYRVVGYDKNEFKHIFPELLISSKWIPADTTAKFQMGKRPPKFPAEKIYNFQGENIMPIKSLAGTIKVPKETVQNVIFNTTWDILRKNWNAGLINLADIESYIRVIDEGNSPGRFTIADPVMRAAIVQFRDKIKSTNAISAKPLSQMQGLNGLGGLDGFLSSIWNGVKSAVGTVVGAVKTVIGGSDTKVTVEVPETSTTTKTRSDTVTLPTTTVNQSSSMFESPVFLLGLGLLGYLAFIKR